MSMADKKSRKDTKSDPATPAVDGPADQPAPTSAPASADAASDAAAVTAPPAAADGATSSADSRPTSSAAAGAASSPDPKLSAPGAPAASAAASAPKAPPRTPPASSASTPARRSGGGFLALLIAILAAALGGYAAWRVVLLERADGNRYSSLGQQLDALDVRVADTDRRAARSNELAATLREQLGENERLHQRMREDVLALADRNARSESLLAEMARGQRSARQQLALADAAALISQAELRLRLFVDRAGAGSALALAEDNLARVGNEYADLRHAVASARSELADDPRPSSAALLRELDSIAAGLAGLAIRIERPVEGSAVAGAGGWWSRQFARLDRLVSIRHEDEAVSGAVMPSRDGVRRALDRARLAVLENDFDSLPEALRTLRAALVGCCEPETTSAPLQRLDRLLALDWLAPLPDLSALRLRLEDQATIQQLPAATPESDASGASGGTLPGPDDDTGDNEQEGGS